MKKRDLITKRVISKKSRQDSKKVFEESVTNINRKKMTIKNMDYRYESYQNIIFK